jgi:hypothetical protein
MKDSILIKIVLHVGRKFRRRFRVPYDLFIKIKELCMEKGIFQTKIRSRIPIEFKILISLRILARGNCCDDLNEFSSVGESTCNYIFHKFVTEFVEHFFSTFVCLPSAETLKKSVEVYSRLGIPGAVFSMDCTHIYLDKCPIEYANICNGKEGKPTLAFQVAVDHFRHTEILWEYQNEYVFPTLH